MLEQQHTSPFVDDEFRVNGHSSVVCPFSPDEVKYDEQ